MRRPTSPSRRSRWTTSLAHSWAPWALMSGLLVAGVLTSAVVQLERRDVQRFRREQAQSCRRGEDIRAVVRALIALADPEKIDPELQRVAVGVRVRADECNTIGR